MTNKQKAQLDVLVRVQRFVDRNRIALAKAACSPAHAAIQQAVRRIRALDSERRDAQARAYGLTARKAELRRKLRRGHMLPISRTARALHGDRRLLTKFRVPHHGASEANLLCAAVRMAEVAAACRGAFLDWRFRPDFVDQLRNAVGAIGSAVVERDAARKDGVLAAVAMVEEIRKAGRMLGVVDAVVGKAVAGRARLSREWEAARYRAAA